jgi:hypothetical protein
MRGSLKITILVTAILTLATAVMMITMAVLLQLAVKMRGRGGARECGDVTAATTTMTI